MLRHVSLDLAAQPTFAQARRAGQTTGRRRRTATQPLPQRER